ncbi:MAG: hypothetical protein HUU29_04155 [Planctomycetaceae bacterium]|nr:hypothetical protein [Planctomycetaceae bacterium]
MKLRTLSIVALFVCAGAAPVFAGQRVSVRAGFTSSSHHHHGSSSRHQTRYVEKKVWVPCWDEVICEEVWIPGHFEDRVTITRECGVEVRRIRREWVPGRYEHRDRTIHHEGYYTIVYERVDSCHR